MRNVKMPTTKDIPAFPTGSETVRLLFPQQLDKRSAEDPSNYSTRLGLKILRARGDPNEGGTGVTLTTEPMNGEAMIVDAVRAEGLRTTAGATLQITESREFIHGIASLPGIQWPADERSPFYSRFQGILACASCQKDGGVNSNHLIDQLGFSFLHVEKGGPFNSIKVVGKKHVPGIEEEVDRLRPQGLSPHVLWSGGEIQTVVGETRLVDTGFMAGAIMPATPKKFPPPFRVKTRDITGPSAKTIRAKALQGVIVRFDNVTIDKVYAPGAYRAISAPHLGSFVFHDDSAAKLDGILLRSVTVPLRAGKHFQTLRALLHQPRKGHYEAIVELNEHFNYQSGFGNLRYSTGEGEMGYGKESSP